MFNNISQEHEPKDYKRYIGVVIENNDPKRCQRIKVNIPNRMDGPVENLDWIAPIQSSPFGIARFWGTMRVPALGSTVVVHFQDNNIKYGLYEGSAVHQNFQPHVELLINYPRRYGFVDPAGNYAYIDYTPDQVEMCIYHVSGTNFVIDNEGNISGYGVANLDMEVEGNTTVLTHGNTVVTTDGNTTVTTTGNTTVNTQGSTEIATQGNTTINTQGNAAINTQGNSAINTQGNSAISTHGDASVTANGAMTITAEGDLTLNSTAGVSLTGPNVNINP
jgi:hypothetical protein